MWKVGGDGRDYETAGGWKLEAAGLGPRGRAFGECRDIAGIRFGLGKGAQVLGPLQRLTAERPLLRTLFLSLFRTDKAKFQLSGPSGANAANGAKRREGVKLDMRLLRNGFRIQMGPLHAEEVRHEEPATATRRDCGLRFYRAYLNRKRSWLLGGH